MERDKDIMLCLTCGERTTAEEMPDAPRPGAALLLSIEDDTEQAQRCRADGRRLAWLTNLLWRRMAQECSCPPTCLSAVMGPHT